MLTIIQKDTGKWYLVDKDAETGKITPLRGPYSNNTNANVGKRRYVKQMRDEGRMDMASSVMAKRWGQVRVGEE